MFTLGRFGLCYYLFNDERQERMVIGEQVVSASLQIPSSEGNFLTYIREVSLGDQKGYAVCTDEGVQLAVFSSMDAAYFSARQFNLCPVSVH